MTGTVVQLRLFSVLRVLLSMMALAAIRHGPDAQAASLKGVEDAMRTEVGVDWENVRLHNSLQRLAATADLPLLIDRRVDTESRASLSVDGVSLSRALQVATAPHGLGFATRGSVVYVGPARSAAALREIGPRGRLPRVFRREMFLSWPRLTEPRELIVERMPKIGPLLENPDAIPHDLWPAGRLPQMLRGDQLTLLLIGFDLTWELIPGDRSGAWRIKPIDYAALPPPSERAETAEHGRRKPRRGAKQSAQRYTLRVANQPLRAVLEQIAKRVDRELEIEPAAVADAEKSVSFAVSEATLEELVGAAGSAAGLRAEVSGRKIRVTK